MNKSLDTMKSYLEEKYSERSHTGNISDFEQDLLKTFERFKTGIGLYKSNSDHTAWSEVVLNDSGFPEQIPCNN
ncbi:hypothetical protein Q764_14455 [Flavobacterium suncheonense GH29-5 = DSM 17707]|uniref:Uncharacterized protein n=2 Tax=Flavobacterium suncheonense TaxID=350894 RepID=A0A0A2LZ21_9FLAO|nr:hypothetical protein Q764_14455 [Flavobacterium suncheonense GH29-5 = DSM 17707]